MKHLLFVCFSIPILGTQAFSQNVGINTDGSIPGMMLDIKTSPSASSDGLRINNPNTGNGDAIINFQVSGTSIFSLGIDDSDSDKFKIGTGGDISSSTLFTMLANGDVGLGTSTPSSNFHISDGHGINYYLEAIRLEHDKWWAGQSVGMGLYNSIEEQARIQSVLYSGGSESDLRLSVLSSGTLTETMRLYDGEVTVQSLAGTGTASGKLVRGTGGVAASSGSIATVSTNMHASEDDMTKTSLLSSHSDDATYTVPWGFDFVIDGVIYTQGWISTNGILGFGSTSSTSYTNTAIPTSILSDPMLFFHWNDNSSQDIKYVINGTTPGRTCNIYWKGNASSGGGGTDMYILITLHETSNVINVSYISENDWGTSGNTWSNNSTAAGSSSTFGFQGAGGAASETIPLGYNVRMIDDNRYSGTQFFSLDF